MNRVRWLTEVGTGLLLSMIVVLPAAAVKVELNFYSDFLHNNVMDLQNEIYYELPGIRFDKYKLDRVEITASSNGHVKLLVNNKEADSVRVLAPFKFKTYSLNNTGPSAGGWLLQATGTAKVYGATVYFSAREFSAAEGWTLQKYCNCRTEKRCYIRQRSDGVQEFGPCQYDCPDGCRE